MTPQFTNRPNAKLTLEGGGTHWHSRSVASCVLAITPDRKAVIVRRGANLNHAGEYCLPCGYVDWDETVAQGARRELFEETGILVDEDRLMNYDINDDPNKDELQNITFHYVVFLDEKDLENLVVDQDEVTEIVCVAPFVEDGRVYAFNHKERIRDFFSGYVDMDNAPLIELKPVE